MMVFGDLNHSFAPRGLNLLTKSKGGKSRKLCTIEIMVHCVIGAVNNTNQLLSSYFLLIYFELLIHFFR